MGKESFKKTKFEDRILQEVNSCLRTKLSDSRFQFVSVTKVILTSDFSIANIYWDTYDSTKRGDLNIALEKVRGKIRSLLASSLGVRHTPELKFSYDSQFVEEDAITKILNEERNSGKFLDLEDDQEDQES